MKRRQIRDRLPRSILHKLPDTWRTELASVAAEPITTGMGGAKVLRLRTEPLSFLKFAEKDTAAALRQERARTSWLADHGIRVAPVLRFHDDGRNVAMQTEALPGVPADRSDWSKMRLLAALGRALATLHALPAAECPFDESLAVRLAQARRAVERDEVDAEQFDTRNRGATPEVVLARVVANPPLEDFVVAHGDAAWNNMIVAPDGAVGFVDCGHAGRADRYLDLAMAAAEIKDHFGADAVKIFADAYGERRWDAQKAAFYCDLYELF
jgi:aminoglycoside 3'-phosphotransferase-2